MCLLRFTLVVYLETFISFLSNCFLLGFEFWVEQLELGLDSRCLSLNDGFFTRFKEGLRGTWVCYGDLSWFLRNTSDLLLLLVFGLKSEKETGEFFVLLLFWLKTVRFFPSSSLILPLWSCWIHCFRRWIWRLNCRGTVQWWWFSDESLRIVVNSIALCLNFGSGKLGFLRVLELLWVCCDFDPNCQEREKWHLFVMMWIALCGSVSDLYSGGLL